MVYTPDAAAKASFDALLTEKVPADQHANWRHHAMQSTMNYGRAYSTLKRMADLPEHARPTEEGLYRDPETDKLYRLKRVRWDLIVSEYSERAALRLTMDNEVVKRGTWKKMNAFASRMFIRKMRASWLMSDEDKVQYRTGMCNFCYRGLIDARSVWHNYGPVCAKSWNLPWGDLPTDAK